MPAPAFPTTLRRSLPPFGTSGRPKGTCRSVRRAGQLQGSLLFALLLGACGGEPPGIGPLAAAPNGLSASLVPSVPTAAALAADRRSTSSGASTAPTPAPRPAAAAAAPRAAERADSLVGEDFSDPRAIPTDPAARTQARLYVTASQAAALEERLRGRVVWVEIDCCQPGNHDLAVLTAFGTQAAKDLPDHVPFLVRGNHLREAATVVNRLTASGLPRVYLIVP